MTATMQSDEVAEHPSATDSLEEGEGRATVHELSPPKDTPEYVAQLEDQVREVTFRLQQEQEAHADTKAELADTEYELKGLYEEQRAIKRVLDERSGTLAAIHRLTRP